MAKATKTKKELKAGDIIQDKTKDGDAVTGVYNPVFDGKEQFSDNKKSEDAVTWVEGVKKDLDEHIEKLAPSKPPVEELTEEQKITKYIANAHSERVDLAPILKSLYPPVTFTQPAEYLQQGESKRLKGLLEKMKASGDLNLADEQYLKLGSFYYSDGDTKTKHHNLDSLKIFATK